MATAIVKLNGREIDVAKAVPLTMGDWRALRKLGVTPQALARLGEDVDVEVLAAYAFYVLHKADPAVTSEEVDGLTFEQLSPIMQIIGAAGRTDGDRPFSAPSTPSAPPTGGPSETSTS
jgi:hypothetical protein